MGFSSVIRRWALRDKVPIREIARRTGLSRNTTRKYLREGIVEPQFRTPSRPTKLDPYLDKLSTWLVPEQRKSRKDRRTAKQIHADLGYIFVSRYSFATGPKSRDHLSLSKVANEKFIDSCVK